MANSDSLRNLELGRVLFEASTILRHDLSNRLGSIRNMAFFVRKRVAGSEAAEKDPRIVQFLDTIEKEVERATALIDDWTARVTSGHEHHLQKVMASSVVDLAVTTARIVPSVTIQVACEERTLSCDPLELSLALRCLVENAAEAMGQGTVEVVGTVEQHRYHFTVKDRGPGVGEPKELLQRLASTKNGHLGVGLCMAKRLVEAGGGTLVFASGPEGGSHVGFSLPVPPEVAQSEPARAPPAANG